MATKIGEVNVDVILGSPKTSARRPFKRFVNTDEFRENPAGVLEKVTLNGIDVVVVSDLPSEALTGSQSDYMSVAALIPIARYQYFQELEARVKALADNLGIAS